MPASKGCTLKILIVADLHYALPQFDWLVAAAPAYDLVILAGDMLDISSPVDPGTQIVVVLNYLKQLRSLTQIVVCSGNHDLDADGLLLEREKGQVARLGFSVQQGDARRGFGGDVLHPSWPVSLRAPPSLCSRTPGKEGVQVITAMQKITSPAVRRHVINLIESLSGSLTS